MHTTHKFGAPRHCTMRMLGNTAAALCLTLAFGANAAPGDGTHGTQGPADSSIQGLGQGPAQGQARASCTPDTPSDEALLGKTLAEAKTMLHGCPWRIGMQDGKALPVTRDYRADRRTLTIENDKVASVTRG